MSSAQVFPNYKQIPARVPRAAWHALRVVSVAFVLGVAGLLLLRPEQGLELFWGILVPSLPLVFFAVPGLWRNLCPLGAVNQLPRVAGFSRGATLGKTAHEYAFVLGMTVFFVAVPARHLLLNHDGVATAALVFAALALAFTGGFVFKGKSGWCSTFCPLLPVQRLYGQTPFVLVPNSHCEPCVGCTKNCYDFNPQAAYLADQYDDDPHYRGYRRVFAGAFPGLVVAYFTTVPGAESAAALYLRFATYLIASVGLFHFLDTFLKLPRARLTAIFAVVALNLFYWFVMPLLVQNWWGLFGYRPLSWVAPALQAALAAASLWWLVRSARNERLFRRATAGTQAVGLSDSARSRATTRTARTRYVSNPARSECSGARARRCSSSPRRTACLSRPAAAWAPAARTR
jgi:nitrite reductase (NADH) large subunit